MGKKVREYKSGDFIFAKVKGYPAWPARVQRMNGKKYFVYFYGTGETANLPPNMIFDYAENKDKFLTKQQKRRDFNDGVKQIEHDFANNVPLEQVIGVPMEIPVEANETADSALGATFDESAVDTTANDTINDTNDQTLNATQNDAVVEDSDDAGNLVIDEGKTPAKGKKATAKPKETPKKETKTRGKKKEDVKEDDPEKKEEEVVSRSGRKIKPKRYIDEATEENATLVSPAKKRRGASPSPVEKDNKEKEKKDVNFTQFNAVKQSELEGLKAPFKPVDEEKDNILIAYLPSGTYVGIKLFQSRPNSFKNDQSKLQWDKQAASNAITLKYQLERDQITPESVQGQLVMDLNLTDEEKVTLDKERETEEKKARVQFLKTEMKLIELDAKIKTCLCLEKADTELCLTLLDELLALFTGMEVRPLMLLKHPTCLETVKRMRAYVGNTPSWDLNEKEALIFSKQAHKIRKKADTLYQTMKDLFATPDGLSFWEFFSERVVVFKKASSHLNASELLEMVHEPLEMTQPTSHTMSAAIEEANKMSPPSEDELKKKKSTPAKSKKPATPAKPKRQSRRHVEAEDEAQNDTEEKEPEGDKVVEEETQMEVDETAEKDDPKEQENPQEEAKGDAPNAADDEQTNKQTPDPEQNTTENTEQTENQKDTDDIEKTEKTKPEKEKSTDKVKKDKKSEKNAESEKQDDEVKEDSKQSKDKSNKDKKSKDNSKDAEKNGKDSDKVKDDESDKSEEKESGELRAKRSRESKKTEAPPPRSPAKRKSKF